MSGWLHPWVGEQKILLQRSVAAKRTLLMGATLGLLVCALAIAALATEASAPSMMAGGILKSFVAWPWAVAVILASFAYTAMRRRLLMLSNALRAGWWASAPIDPHLATRTLLLIAALWTTAWGAFFSAGLLLLAWVADAGDALPAVLTVFAASIAVGSVFGTWSALSHRGRHGRNTVPGLRQPLFSLLRLDDSRLPHLLTWQRGEAVLRWRTGGQAWVVGAILMGATNGTSMRRLLGVLVLAVSITWLSVVSRVCIDTALDARRLLAATPVPARRLAFALSRYPMFAGACALLMGAMGAWMLDRFWIVLAAWTAISCLLLMANLAIRARDLYGIYASI